MPNDDLQQNVKFEVVSDPGWEPKEHKGQDYWKYNCRFNGQKELVAVPLQGLRKGATFVADLSSWDYNGKTYFRALDPREAGAKHPSEQSTQERSQTRTHTAAPVFPGHVLKEATRRFMQACVDIVAHMDAPKQIQDPECFSKLVATTAVVGEKLGLPQAYIDNEQQKAKAKADNALGRDEDLERSFPREEPPRQNTPEPEGESEIPF